VPADTTFTGLALHAEPRVYEGFANWDLGFSWLAGGRLHYRGEECAFALAPDEVESVETAPGPPAWIRTKVVRIRWRDAAGTIRSLRFTPLDSRTLAGIPGRSDLLCARLQRWHAEGHAAPTAASPSPPPVSDVTCSRPRDLVKPAGFVRLLVWSAMLAVPIAAVLQVSYLPVLATACVAEFVLTVPMARHRDEKPAGQATPDPKARAAA
jgi:hypothetical protein